MGCDVCCTARLHTGDSIYLSAKRGTRMPIAVIIAAIEKDVPCRLHKYNVFDDSSSRYENRFVDK
jgi:hypothetical protein